MRGKEHCLSFVYDYLGITPAYAGKSYCYTFLSPLV